MSTPFVIVYHLGMADVMISRQDAAARLGVSLRTVARYLAEGRLNKYQRLGRVYVSAQQVQSLGSFSAKA